MSVPEFLLQVVNIKLSISSPLTGELARDSASRPVPSGNPYEEADKGRTPCRAWGGADPSLTLLGTGRCRNRGPHTRPGDAHSAGLQPGLPPFLPTPALPPWGTPSLNVHAWSLSSKWSPLGLGVCEGHSPPREDRPRGEIRAGPEIRLGPVG